MKESFFIRHKDSLFRQMIVSWLIISIGVIVFTLIALGLSRFIDNQEIIIIAALFLVFPLIIVMYRIYIYKFYSLSAIEVLSGIEQNEYIREKSVNSRKVEYLFKRILDLTIVLLALPLVLPLIIILAIIVKLDTKGPSIYRHRRIGQYNSPFDLLKFRTMISGDDTSFMLNIKELIENQSNAHGEKLLYRKMSDNVGVTRVGRLLRKYSLDELPQLFNVLKGDMSLVGPRPHVQFEVDFYTEEQHRRLSVKPGMTGLWQIAGKADNTFSEMILLDLDYTENWSFWLDVQIISKTTTLVLQSKEWVRVEVDPNTWTKNQFYLGSSQLQNQ